MVQRNAAAAQRSSASQAVLAPCLHAHPCTYLDHLPQQAQSQLRDIHVGPQVLPLPAAADPQLGLTGQREQQPSSHEVEQLHGQVHAQPHLQRQQHAARAAGVRHSTVQRVVASDTSDCRVTQPRLRTKATAAPTYSHSKGTTIVKALMWFCMAAYIVLLLPRPMCTWHATATTSSHMKPSMYRASSTAQGRRAPVERGSGGSAAAGEALASQLCAEADATCQAAMYRFRTDSITSRQRRYLQYPQPHAQQAACKSAAVSQYSAGVCSAKQCQPQAAPSGYVCV